MTHLKLFFAIFLISVLALISSGCDKSITAKEMPSLLLKADLTPGDTQNKLILFMETSKAPPTIETELKENKYYIIKLNNTFKASKVKDLDITGVEDKVKKARVIQIINKDKPENPVVTKFIFTILSPDTEIAYNIKEKAVTIKEVNEEYDNIQGEKVPIVAASKGHSPDSWVVTAISLGFILLVLFLLIYFIGKKA